MTRVASVASQSGKNDLTGWHFEDASAVVSAIMPTIGHVGATDDGHITSGTIAIGDIQGCSIALTALIEAINPSPEDTIIPFGDYVDRGIDSKGVLDQLIDLSSRFKLMPIPGSHDQMRLHARDGQSDFEFWLNCGADGRLVR